MQPTAELIARARRSTIQWSTAAVERARQQLDRLSALSSGQPSRPRKPTEPRWRRIAESDAAERWRSRPVLAFLVKALVVVIPGTAAILVTALLNWGMTPPSSVPVRVGWWVLLLAISTVVAVAVERQTRRMLPLAVLLKLTLLFPDGAPSRYQMARAANNPHRLRELAAGRSPQSRAAAEVLAWVAELARHDRHTRGHSERVRVFADLLAEQLNLTRIEKDKLRWASLLHDVGKLQVPARILNKPAKPNLSEWEVLRRHPAAGMELVGPLAEWLGPWAGGIADHHERFDGTGYPNGLSGTDISLAGRIVAVADSYETMTAVRPYKRAMAAAAGRAELARCAGSHFDPAIVRAFLNIGLPRMLYGIGPISFLFHFPFLGRLPEAGLSLMSVASQAAAPVAAGLTAGAVATATVVSPTAPAGAVGHQPVTGSGRVAAAASSSTPLAGPALSLGLDRMTEIASAPSTFAAGSVPDPVIRAGHGGAAPAPGTNGAPASGGTGTRAGKGAAGGSSSGSGNPGNGNSGNSNSGNSNSGKSSSSKGSSGNSGSGKANSGNSGNGNSGSHSSGGTATTPGQTKTKTNTGSAGGHKTGASGTGATTGSSSSTPPTSPGHSKRSNAVGGSSGPGPSGSSSASHGKAHSTAG